MKTNIIGFVPARSGSTRLKDKNIKKISNRPLIYWTIAKAIKSKKFDKIIFSSDSKKYFQILIRYLKRDNLNFNNLIFDKRKKKHAKKKSKIFDYLKDDLIKKFDLNNNDLLVQMLPTCPLRNIKRIKEIIDFSLKNKKNSFSVNEYDFHVSFALNITSNGFKPLLNKSPLITGNTQSQNQKTYFHPNGSIYCLFIKNLKKKSKSIYENAFPYVTSKLESLDIDTLEDFNLVKKIMK